MGRHDVSNGTLRADDIRRLGNRFLLGSGIALVAAFAGLAVISKNAGQLAVEGGAKEGIDQALTAHGITNPKTAPTAQFRAISPMEYKNTLTGEIGRVSFGAVDDPRRAGPRCMDIELKHNVAAASGSSPLQRKYCIN